MDKVKEQFRSSSLGAAFYIIIILNILYHPKTHNNNTASKRSEEQLKKSYSPAVILFFSPRTLGKAFQLFGVSQVQCIDDSEHQSTSFGHRSNIVQNDYSSSINAIAITSFSTFLLDGMYPHGGISAGPSGRHLLLCPVYLKKIRK